VGKGIGKIDERKPKMYGGSGSGKDSRKEKTKGSVGVNLFLLVFVDINDGLLVDFKEVGVLE